MFSYCIEEMVEQLIDLAEYLDENELDGYYEGDFTVEWGDEYEYEFRVIVYGNGFRFEDEDWCMEYDWVTEKGKEEEITKDIYEHIKEWAEDIPVWRKDLELINV